MKGATIMYYKQYTNVKEFYDATYFVLMRHEAQNTIPLGNLILGNKGNDKTGWRDPVNWFMATVCDTDSGGIQLTAIMTPPYNIALYATGNIICEESINCLINGIAGHPVPGVTAEKSLAKYFADLYTSRKGMSFEVSMDQRIYELTEVNPEIPRIGTIRLSSEKDMPFLPFWCEAFHASGTYGSTTMEIPNEPDDYLYRISKNNLYVLEYNGVSVSLAGLNREMQTVIGVGPVYTPPYYRGKGYASSAVAQISQLALDRGFKKCVLYTDLANPTSNSIYQKIGYRPICDSLMLKFI